METISEYFVDLGAVMALWYLANDSVGYSEATPYVLYAPRVWKTEGFTMRELVEHYNSIDRNVLWDFVQLIAADSPSKYEKYCEMQKLDPDWRFINADGQAQLKKEFPNIWDGFALEKLST